jgi:hypothetical protein
MPRQSVDLPVARSAQSLWWSGLFVLLRAVALLFAVATFADLLFFGDEYRRASAQFHLRYQISSWLLVFLAVYPRLLIRLSGLFAVPLMLVSVVAAYVFNWLARNEVLSSEPALKNGLALMALAFAFESYRAFMRKGGAKRIDKPVRKW